MHRARVNTPRLCGLISPMTPLKKTLGVTVPAAAGTPGNASVSVFALPAAHTLLPERGRWTGRRLASASAAQFRRGARELLLSGCRPTLKVVLVPRHEPTAGSSPAARQAGGGRHAFHLLLIDRL